MKDINMHSKSFLNDSLEEFGTVAWHVQVASHQFDRDDDCKHIPRNANLRITDCHDDIHLCFYHRSKEDYKERLAKLDTLINELKSFRSAMVKMNSYGPMMEKHPDVINQRTQEKS